ncbi:DUF2142 domain-containing protein [Solirubrobacter sp. CPCC 204708]|uniref:Glycosyltransferase family 39 protein n=1 Tax=Solirubrobacter deserti TaxID=2282478 RepID=A0ABT4RNA3_9ACTN|nr:DUF2142 domain-containing protein [Solirubrobacter deserti]MBE2317415.1 DUF2142 domain-containing protein [Solirubrobacter deserti]MDA0139997.1 glycosyltransferase family 39 protein [Solirubrobacter deserti]
MRRVPAPLAALMTTALLLAVTWAAFTPAFQAPDEQSHFAYTQFFAETGDLPGDPGKPIYSSEHIHAAQAAGSDYVMAQPFMRPEWSERRLRVWQDGHAREPRDDGGGPHSAAGYPPASYAWEAIGYRLAGGDFFDRLTAARIFSALWLPVTVLGAWLLAGELFGRRRELQVAAAAVPALLPMFAFVSGSVSPDGMMYALWSLVLWLGVKALRTGLTPARAFVLVALVGAACLTKATSYALLAPAALVLGVGLWRSSRRLPVAGAAVAAIAVWVALAALVGRAVGGDIVVSATGTRPGVRGFGSYLWDFYVPRSLDDYPPFDTFLVGSWAAFGWLEVRFDRGLYLLAAAAVLLVLGGAGFALWRTRSRVDPWTAAFVALAVLALLGGLHWTDYRLSLSEQPFMQGRYLLPVGALMGAAAAGALTLVPAVRRSTALTAGLAFLFAVHVASIGLLLDRFYA